MTTLAIQTWDADTPDIRVPVTNETTGAAEPLTGATVEAWAKRRGTSAAVVELSASITDAAGGIITVSIGAGDLDEGVYALQVRVTKSGEVQTVLDAIVTVKPSYEGGA